MQAPSVRLQTSDFSSVVVASRSNGPGRSPKFELKRDPSAFFRKGKQNRCACELLPIRDEIEARRNALVKRAG